MSRHSLRTELIRSLESDISDRRVLQAMLRVPREMFVPSDLRHAAYDDRPLPIGEGQTISQPFIIAYMTQALRLSDSDKVLELGTGSGYQTAILAELARAVVTVERLSSLLGSARSILQQLGYDNIEFHLAGETLGWPEGAPYDAVLVTAAAPTIPQDLVDQLTDGGRLVIPVGSKFEQDLYQVTRIGGETIKRNLGGCRFVPLIGKGAWSH